MVGYCLIGMLLGHINTYSAIGKYSRPQIYDTVFDLITALCT